MMKERVCAVCGKDLYRKKVWAKHKQRVIGYCCGPTFLFWLDGTVYDTRVGPNEEQRKQLGAKQRV